MIDTKTRKLALNAGIDLEAGHFAGKDGRFILASVRQFPGAHTSGNALRARVVWWLHTGDALKGVAYHIHHKNENNTDDRFCNLEKLSDSDHSTLHGTKQGAHVECVCEQCGKKFTINLWRLKETSAGRGKYCSQVCYRLQPKTLSVRTKISEGLIRAYAEARR